jgi:MFS family permease
MAEIPLGGGSVKESIPGDKAPETERFEADIARIPSSNLALPFLPAPETARPSGEPAQLQKQLGRKSVALLVLATFGGSMAMIVPMSFTLALRLDQIAPGREEFLGYMLGAGSTFSLLAAPLTGVLSDRTRSRWGRRRPYTVAGATVGLAAIPLMAYAPNVLLLGVGWVLSTVGWHTAMGSINNYQADNLPKFQRGRVAGLTSLARQIAPVAGIILVGQVVADPLWVFLLPAMVGVLLVLGFVVFAPEGHSPRRLEPAVPLSLKNVLQSFMFNPRQHPAFAWTWGGRFMFFLGLSLTTSYSTFFYAQRLDLSVADVSTVIAAISAGSIITSTVGAIGGGWLSDRAASRQPFILVATVIYAAGALVSAFSHSLVSLVTGSLITSLGIAVFVAVGQALVLDVLPHRETQAGRFTAITSSSQKIPSALAPALAPLLLSIAAFDNSRNYTVLYVAAGMLAVLGGLITLLGSRATHRA